MEETKNFDSKEELKKLSIKRLFVLQKLELENLSYYFTNTIYDKNDVFKKIEELKIINLIITKKIANDKIK